MHVLECLLLLLLLLLLLVVPGLCMFLDDTIVTRSTLVTYDMVRIQRVFFTKPITPATVVDV